MKSFWSLSKTGRLVGLAMLSTAFVACGGGEDGADGVDGTTALISTSEASAEECEHGGTVISVGVDANGNGELDADEITSTTVVCDGASGATGDAGTEGPAGEDGADGADGVDGDVPLVEFSDEPAGENCTLGGVRIDTGIDADGDGELSEEEITDTTYVCSSTCDGGAIDLVFGDADADGTIYNNFDSVTFPITTTETDLSFSVYGATEGFSFDYDLDMTDGLTIYPKTGEGDLEFIALFTNGCGMFAQAVSVSGIETGESTVYLGHFFSGAGEVDVNFSGTDTTIASFDFTDVLGPLPMESNLYSFDIVAEGVVAGTTPELTFAPNGTYMVYAYNDGGNLAFGAHDVDTTAPADGEAYARFTHLGSGVGPVDGWLFNEDGAVARIFEGLGFGESTDMTVLEAAEDAYFALDVDGDEAPDFSFFQTEGAFDEGNVLDGFVFLDGNGNVWTAAFDYINGVTALVKANVPNSSPNTPLASNTSTMDIINIADCDEVVEITMDIVISSDPNASFIVWENELTVSLTAPDGEEVLLWNRGGGGLGTNGLAGNFNKTLAPSGDDAEPIANLVGVNGNGDWTVMVATSYHAIFNSWALDLECL